MKKTTVTIGIPAYNEEAIIGKLIHNLLSQKTSSFMLEKILVVSDGSDDNTNLEVQKIKNHNVELLINKKRKGLNPVQNILIKKTTSDILVIINADVLPSSKLFLEYLILPILRDKKIGLVSARTIAIKGSNFTSKALSHLFNLREKISQKYNNSDNVFLCHGQARAFSKELYKKIKWPYGCPEDSYSYFFCKKNKLDFYYQKKAIIYFSTAKTIGDHLRQNKRFWGGVSEIEKKFGSQVKRNYKLPLILIVSIIAIALIRQPILTFFYILMQLSFLFIKYKKVDQSRFEISKSSKVFKV